jgi:capsule polysaccharide export protein KpsE/RkpR
MNPIDLPAPSQADENEDDEASLRLIDIAIWLGEGKRLIALVTIAAAIVAVVLALLKPNIFTARTSFLPPTSQQGSSSSAAALAALGSLGSFGGGLAGKTPDELYVSLLKSDSVQRALTTKFKLFERYQIDSYEAMRKWFPLFVRVTSDKKSGLITVEVDDKDPQFAAQLANAYAAEVSQLLSRLAVSEAQQRRVFFEQQLKETKENLIRAEQALRQVQEKSGMVVMDQQAEAIIKAVAELKARIVEREVRLKVLRTSTTEQNPDVQLLNSELTALRGELARMETATGSGKGGSIDIPVGKLPAAAVDYVRALREVKFQETMLSSMLRQFEVAKLDEAKEGASLQQVDVAQPPDRKSKPARSTFVIGITFGALLLSSMFVVLRRYRAVARERNAGTDAAWGQLAQAWRLRR